MQYLFCFWFWPRGYQSTFFVLCCLLYLFLWCWLPMFFALFFFSATCGPRSRWPPSTPGSTWRWRSPRWTNPGEKNAYRFVGKPHVLYCNHNNHNNRASGVMRVRCKTRLLDLSRFRVPVDFFFCFNESHNLVASRSFGSIPVGR